MRVLICVAIIALLLLTILSVHAAAEALNVDVHKHVLDNGLTLLLVEREGAPVFYNQTVFRVGSANEIGGITGAAHLLEHMMFKGTREVGTTDWKKERTLMAFQDSLYAYLDELEREQEKRDFLGMQAETGNGELAAKIEFVHESLAEVEEQLSVLVVPNELEDIYNTNGAYGFNAFTGYDLTGYIVAFPRNRMDLFMALESERLMNPVFREFYSERDVVIEERRLRVDTQGSSKLFEQLIATAFVAHPYQIYWEWKSEVANLTRDELYGFFNTFYSPSNAVVAIVGDIDIPQTIAAAEKYFGEWQTERKLRHIDVVEPKQTGERRVVVEFDANPAVNIAYHKTAFDHPDDAVFQVIQRILSQGRTSRFYQNLVEGKRVALYADAFQFPWGELGSADPNVFVIDAAPKAPATAEELEQAILTEIEALKTIPVTDDELQKTKNNMRSEFIWGMYSGFGLAGRLSEAEALVGDYRYIGTMQEKIAGVTAEDVMRVAQEYFTAGNRTVAVLEPISKEMIYEN